MITDNSILEDQGCQKKIKVADDQIIPARKRSWRGIIRSCLRNLLSDSPVDGLLPTVRAGERESVRLEGVMAIIACTDESSYVFW